MKKSTHLLAWLGAMVIIAALAYWLGTRHTVSQPVSVPIDSNSNQSTQPSSSSSPKAETSVTPSPSEETKTTSAQDILYTNNEYGFRLTLPKNWQSFRTVKRNGVSEWPGLDFQLPHDDGSYGTVLTINAFTPDEWQKLQSEGGPLPERLGANTNFVFAYGLPQVIEKFAGYPEEVPGLAYKGPVFEAEDIVLPRFQTK